MDKYEWQLNSEKEQIEINQSFIQNNISFNNNSGNKEKDFLVEDVIGAGGDLNLMKKTNQWIFFLKTINDKKKKLTTWIFF